MDALAVTAYSQCLFIYYGECAAAADCGIFAFRATAPLLAF